MVAGAAARVGAGDGGGEVGSRVLGGRGRRRIDRGGATKNLELCCVVAVASGFLTLMKVLVEGEMGWD